MKYRIIISIIASFCFSNSAIAKDFYVNQYGNDLWLGSLKQPNANKTNGPFRTIERAKQAIRALKQTNTFIEKVTVNIAAGRYYLNQPLNFNIMDSGLPGKEILWQGEPGTQVTISAGLPISCNKRDAQFWDCPLTKLPISTAYFDSGRIRGKTPKFELFVNDQKIELARWPDKGWAHIKLPISANTQFVAMETLPALIGDVSAAQVHIFPGNDWYDQYVGIASINKPANAITLSSPTSYALDSGRRFYLQNSPSLLNAPGEWLFNSSAGKVSFISPAGINPNQFMLSSLPNILVAEGVNYLTFKNLSFQHSTGNAITINNSNNIVMDHLNINNIGGIGVVINAGKNVHLNSSKIHHTGGQGVVVYGGDRNTLQASGHVIYNNHIHHMSTVIMTYSAGIDLNGVGTTVTHNLLEQGAGTAISLTGNDHLIEKNEVHHFCLQASDCGAIYSGRDWSSRGNIIRNNYIHDIIGYGLDSLDIPTNKAIYTSPNGARGVYLDDGDSGFEVSGNIFENAGFMAIQIGGGRDNKITNNYFKTDSYAILIDNRWIGFDWNKMQTNLDASPYKTPIWKKKYPELTIPMHNITWPEGNRVEQNIIISTRPDGLLLQYLVPMDSTVIGDNIIWSTTGNLAVDYMVLELNKSMWAASWPQWVAQRIEQKSIVTNPCVTISNKKMITTCTSSAINDIGFKTLPTDIGLIP
jgi:hypothetical protein